MEELLSANRYEVLLQRTSRKIRCSCFNEKYQEADSKCNKCLGNGWIFKFEKHKAFKQDYTGSPDTAILFTDAGQIEHGYKMFYFKHDTPISVKDYVWEVHWKKSKPSKLINLYRVRDISYLRGDNGRIEFAVALVKKESLDTDFKGMHIGKAWKDLDNNG